MLSHLRTLLIRTATLASMLLAAVAPAQTFSNPATIVIRDLDAAQPYPSNILVSGAPPRFDSIRVTLRGLSHTFPRDIAVAVRSPSGAYHLLMTGVTGSQQVTNANVTFSSNGSAIIGDTLSSGTYAPSRGFDRDFRNGVPPASQMPLGFGSLANINPNGIWSLYVVDDIMSDTGVIAAGWSISFESSLSTSGTTIYQGVLNQNGAPFTGSATVDFQLFDQATGGIALRELQSQSVQVTNGLFQAPLEIGGDLLAVSDARWLQVTVNGQALTPRQEIRPAPSALNAESAATMPWTGLLGQPSIETDAVGAGWQLFFTNNATGFRGGMRLADNGFLEVTNVANNANPNFARLNSTGAWSAVSDRRLKHDIHAAEGNLAAALKLQPVAFRWSLDDREDLGLIAQDVRQVLPHLVTGDESKENLTVNYSQLSVVAIGAIQEQQQKIELLEQRLLDQTRRNDDLQSRLETLEQLLGASK